MTQMFRLLAITLIITNYNSVFTAELRQRRNPQNCEQCHRFSQARMLGAGGFILLSAAGVATIGLLNRNSSQGEFKPITTVGYFTVCAGLIRLGSQIIINFGTEKNTQRTLQRIHRENH